MAQSSCLCGAVRIEALADLKAATICHCSMCRRWHGTPGAYIPGLKESWHVLGEKHVKWHPTSERAECGFCEECGNKLLWREKTGEGMDCLFGLFDPFPGLSVKAHIWVDFKGDYYTIGDGLPCYAQSMKGGKEIKEPPLSPLIRQDTHNGRCLCGSIKYRVVGGMRDILTCHCKTCRRWQGYFAAYSSAPLRNIEVDGIQSLRWYRSSDEAKRGFCGQCGSSMFWAPTAEERWSIAAGTLDQPTGLRNALHIFVESKGNYSIADGIRQVAGGGDDRPIA